MYKGEVCTGKFVFIQAKGYVKVGAVKEQEAMDLSNRYIVRNLGH